MRTNVAYVGIVFAVMFFASASGGSWSFSGQVGSNESGRSDSLH